MMALFILGVLAGWLAEWIFFTFFWKQDSSSADCAALEAELSTKNKTIAVLRSDLENTRKRNKSKENERQSKTASNSSAIEKKTSDAANKTAKLTNQSAKNTGVKEKAAAVSTSTPAARSSNASTEAKPKTKQDKKTSASAKNASATVAPKKARTKKPTTGDDLTKLSGIGPSMASKLHDLGITTYKKLSEMDDDILRDMLEDAGARLNNNKAAMDSWNEQALLADKGDFEGLKKLQDELKGR